MLRSVRLANFKSFGRRTEVPLEPITVLVGPNNSGKSCFLSLARFVGNAILSGGRMGEVVAAEGGIEGLVHRPAVGADVSIAWECTDGSGFSTAFSGHVPTGSLHMAAQGEEVRGRDLVAACKPDGASSARATVRPLRETPGTAVGYPSLSLGKGTPVPFAVLRSAAKQFPEAARPLRARMVRLDETKMREDAEVVPDPVLAPSGAGMAAVLGAWRGAGSDKSNQLDEFLARCVPEIKRVLVQPSPSPGRQRIQVLQQDGQTFDAAQVSDGLLFLIGLAMQAIDAPEHSMLLIEEPERSIHPRRVHEVTELLRALVAERDCQVCMATHSRVLIDRFRDEPEAIVLFRRGHQGTEVRRLSDVPDLVEALSRTQPGDMLESGLFHEPWPDA